jgi:5-formyltetrahydrofolate cyclo-ligase
VPAAASDKAEWRRRIRAARRARGSEIRDRNAALLTATVLDLAHRTGDPICAYLPLGTEPWSPAGVEALRAAGHEVLLPVVAGPDRPLDWARYTGPDALMSGPFGLREPAGPRLGPEAIAAARLVLLPALAVDRRGVRLGQGGGYYDRSLPLVGDEALLVVLLDDGDLVDTLPIEPHDRVVDAVILPSHGLTLVNPHGQSEKS